jgi:DNA-binding FadR family transcriptional regulator
MSKLEPSSMVADRVFKAVHRAIVPGELEAWRRMRILNLAEKLGTSVMPVREAFHRLEKRGRCLQLPGVRQNGCVQCAHSGLRIGSYIGRIGPYSA